MIDLHCHLLDETRWGPDTFDASLAMCRLAIADGVRTIVATPRWAVTANEPPLALATCHEQLATLREQLSDSLQLKLGFLLPFRSDLEVLLANYGAAITLGGGRYVLVALPALQVPLAAETVWAKLDHSGYSVLLARPECNPALRRDAPLLASWVKHGVRLQLDAASIIGLHGREVQRFARLCAQSFPDAIVIASNAQRANRSAANLGRARAELIKTNGLQRVERWVNETPQAILANEQPIFSAQPTPARLRFNTLLRALRSYKSVTDASG